MGNTRTRIADTVQTKPGIHFNGIVRTCDLATGQVQYHLDRLLSEDVLVKADLYGRSHFFPTEYDEWERSTLSLLRRETTREVAAVILESGPTRPNELVEELGLARSTLEWHVNHLVEQDVVEKRYTTSEPVVLEVSRPKDLIELVQKADPTLLGQMVGHFTRLVDRMLAEDVQL
ncbi:winged helix-turn-helix transcriptional regulator [Halodesulfurarchaeum sp.]|uniref:winged helix-turn-helix transcriptional regulator n=1 Tax=Halodesulfurarchaeum sp. TaxID=1980530 RepID=UPI002FC2C9C8